MREDQDWRDKIYPTPEALEAYREKLKGPKPVPLKSHRLNADSVEEDTETERTAKTVIFMLCCIATGLLGYLLVHSFL